MASGAGLNRVAQQGGKPLLLIDITATAVSTPLTGYGTIGSNDSGLVMLEAIGFTKWAFCLVGNTTGQSVTIYGTLDPIASQAWNTPHNGPKGGPDGSTVVPAGSWFKLPGPSEQTGTGGISNPLVAATPLLNVSMPLVAVRAVLTVTSSPAGDCQVLGFAVP